MISRFFKFALAAHGVIMFASDANCQVLEIEPGSDTIVYAGPAVRLGDESRAIAPAAAAPRAKRAPQAATLAYLETAGARQELSPYLLEAIAYVESRFKDDAVSPAGAVGAMQLMPGTAAELGVDPNIPAENFHGGASYLRQMLEMFDGDLTLALAAYNAGPGAVQRHGGVPPFEETQSYVAAVLGYMADIASQETRQ